MPQREVEEHSQNIEIKNSGEERRQFANNVIKNISIFSFLLGDTLTQPTSYSKKNLFDHFQILGSWSGPPLLIKLHVVCKRLWKECLVDKTYLYMHSNIGIVFVHLLQVLF